MVDLRRQWSDLPVHLLEEIMKNLSWADRIRMRSACKRWQQLPIENDGLPWVAAFSRECKNVLVCKVYDPMNPMKPYTSHKIRRDDFFISEPCPIPCKQGWLLFCKEMYDTGVVELFLCHPITNQIVVLPDLHLGIDDTKSIRNGCIKTYLTFSSSPDSEGCMFFALHYNCYGGKAITSTCKKNDEEGWITKRFTQLKQPRTNSVYYQGGFYHASDNGALTCFRVADQKWYSLENTYIPRSAETTLVVLPSDKLLLVLHCNRSRLGKYGDYCSAYYCLFTFNWTIMRWIQISDLKDLALFSGQYSLPRSHHLPYSFAIPAFGCTAAFANLILHKGIFHKGSGLYDISKGTAHVLEGTEFDFLGAIKGRAFWIEAIMPVEKEYSAQFMDKVAQLLAEKRGIVKMISAKGDS